MTPVNETKTSLALDFSSSLTWSSAVINTIIGIAGLMVTTVVLYTCSVQTTVRSDPQPIVLLNLVIVNLVKVLSVFLVQVPMHLHPVYLGGSRTDAAIDVQWLLSSSFLLTWFTYFRYQVVIKRRFRKVKKSFTSTAGLITITWLVGIASFIVTWFRDLASTEAWSPCIHDSQPKGIYSTVTDSFILGIYGTLFTVAVMLLLKVFLRLLSLPFNADPSKGLPINGLNCKRVKSEKGVSKMCLCLVATKGVLTLPMIIHKVCYSLNPALADPNVCVFTHLLHNVTCVTTPTFFLCNSVLRNRTKAALKKLFLRFCCIKSMAQIAPHGEVNRGVGSNSTNYRGPTVDEVSLEQLPVGSDRRRLSTYNGHNIIVVDFEPHCSEADSPISGNTQSNKQHELEPTKAKVVCHSYTADLPPVEPTVAVLSDNITGTDVGMCQLRQNSNGEGIKRLTNMPGSDVNGMSIPHTLLYKMPRKQDNLIRDYVEKDEVALAFDSHSSPKTVKSVKSTLLNSTETLNPDLHLVNKHKCNFYSYNSG